VSVQYAINGLVWGFFNKLNVDTEKARCLGQARLCVCFVANAFCTGLLTHKADVLMFKPSQRDAKLTVPELDALKFPSLASVYHCKGGGPESDWEVLQGDKFDYLVAVCMDKRVSPTIKFDDGHFDLMICRKTCRPCMLSYLINPVVCRNVNRNDSTFERHLLQAFSIFPSADNAVQVANIDGFNILAPQRMDAVALPSLLRVFRPHCLSDPPSDVSTNGSQPASQSANGSVNVNPLMAYQGGPGPASAQEQVDKDV
jgi:hypothetical protein